MGRPVREPVDDMAFMRAAGYDYIQCTVHVPAAELTAAKQAQRGDAATHGADHGIIDSPEHYRSREWSWQAAARGDLRVIQPQLDWLAGLARVLPPGMKILIHNADVFTYAWELVGFSPFCFFSLEQPEFIGELMQSLAAAQLNATRAALDVAGDAAGVLMYSDDIAYTEGLMLRPEFFREFLFPTIGQFVGLGRDHGDLPLIYHTDGRLYDVLDDLARLEVRGIQPLEPKSMDPLEIQHRWPGRFCLLGNIDLDLMARGTPDAVEQHVRERITRLNVGGGYMPGVSNTVPDYVKFENYQRMIETVYSYAD